LLQLTLHLSFRVTNKLTFLLAPFLSQIFCGKSCWICKFHLSFPLQISAISFAGILPKSNSLENARLSSTNQGGVTAYCIAGRNDLNGEIVNN
jgi:hypothetical protein